MSNNSIATIDRITTLKNDVTNIINGLQLKNTSNIFKAINYIFRHPYFDSTDLREALNASKPTVSSILKILLDNNIIGMEEKIC